MAELSSAGAERVLTTLLSAFNRHHGSAYSLGRAEPLDDRSCDYVCVDEGRPDDQVKLQFTRAVVKVETTADGDSAETPIHAWAARRAEKRRSGVVLGSPADFALQAVMEKARRLGPSASDLVLDIFYDFLRFSDDLDLPSMRSAVRSAARRAETRFHACFREIWALWDFEDEPGAAHLLWPIADERRPPRLGKSMTWAQAPKGIDDEGVVHVLDSVSGDGLCGAFLVATNFDGEPPICTECAGLLGAPR